MKNFRKIFRKILQKKFVKELRENVSKFYEKFPNRFFQNFIAIRYLYILRIFQEIYQKYEHFSDLSTSILQKIGVFTHRW